MYAWIKSAAATNFAGGGAAGFRRGGLAVSQNDASPFGFQNEFEIDKCFSLEDVLFPISGIFS